MRPLNHRYRNKFYNFYALSSLRFQMYLRYHMTCTVSMCYKTHQNFEGLVSLSLFLVFHYQHFCLPVKTCNVPLWLQTLAYGHLHGTHPLNIDWFKFIVPTAVSYDSYSPFTLHFQIHFWQNIAKIPNSVTF